MYCNTKKSFVFKQLCTTIYALLLFATIFPSCNRIGPETISNLEVPQDADIIELLIGEPELEVMQVVRDEARETFVILNKKNSRVNARLIINGDTSDVRIRIKGDWREHVEDKWSFRIEMKDTSSWNGKRVFSIQKPTMRGNLDEWVLHKLMQQEGIITTRYDFCFAKLNGDWLGLYAVEEHFTPELLAANKRSKGPILKIDEDAMWKIRAWNEKNDLPYLPYQYALDIVPFQRKKQLSDSVGVRQFKEGQKLVDALRFDLKTSSGLFNVEKVGQYLALIDLCKAQHSLIYHNLRWYYNPKLKVLEPIAYDGYGSDPPTNIFPGAYVGYKVLADSIPLYNNFTVRNLLKDKAVLRAYRNSLLSYVKPDFINHFLKTHRQEILDLEALIKIEDPNYSYDFNFLNQTRLDILNSISPVESYTDSFSIKKMDIGKLNLNENIEQPPMPGISVRAYYEKTIDKKYQVSVLNFHHKKIEVIRIEDKEGNREEISNFKLEAYYRLEKPNNKSIIIGIKPRQIVYRAENDSTIYYDRIVNQPSPTN